jgi:hypothetical protein
VNTWNERVLDQILEIAHSTPWAAARAIGGLGYQGQPQAPVITMFPIIIMLCGDNMTTFRSGDMMRQAGIRDPITRLEVIIVLTATALVIGCVALWYMDYFPRKVLCSLSLGLFAIFLFLLGGLTSWLRKSDEISGVYATLAAVFMFLGAYHFGLTPLTIMYPADILTNSAGFGYGDSHIHNKGVWHVHQIHCAQCIGRHWLEDVQDVWRHRYCHGSIEVDVLSRDTGPQFWGGRNQV